MTDLLPGFDPSESDLVEMALAMPLEKKIEKAILFFREYGEGAYGAFSGGKDSCVIKQLAIDAGVNVDWHYNNVTIDPPELVQFIRKHHSEVKWNSKPIGLLNRMVEKACAPTQFRRWCCAEYKEQGGNDRDKIIGVRIAESPRRSKLWKLVVAHRKTGKLILCPICYWTNDDVWTYIQLRGIPYCSIYDEVDTNGKKLFDRLGCVGCPLAGVKTQQKTFKRWPRFERAWRNAFTRLWAKWHGTLNAKGEPRGFEKYGSAEGFWQWWVTGGDYKGEGDQCVFEDMMEQR